MSAFESARNALSKPVRLACDETISEYEKYWAGRASGAIKGYEYAKSKTAHAAMCKALALVELEREPNTPEKPPIERVDELTPEQRNVVIVLSEDEIPLQAGWSRIYKAARWRRRWLGIDPPSVLDELDASGRPRYESADPLSGLPADRHLEACVEGMLGEYPGPWSELLGNVVATHGQHAGPYAARVLPTLGHEASYIIDTVAPALFLALARSKTPIPEAADRLFPIARHGQLPVRPEWVVEIAAAIPPGRREAAVIGSMQRSDGRANDVLLSVVAILEKDPMPDVIDAALAYAKERKKTRDSHVKGGVVKCERTLVAMKRGAPSAPSKPREPIVLRVESILRPTSVTELDVMRTKQLRIAGDLWEGKRRPPQRRLDEEGDDDASFGGVCEWRVLADDKRRYDAWLFAGDSGQYFIAGTTKRIGEMIQRSVSVHLEKDVDTGLVEALTTASRSGVTVEPASKKTPSPKRLSTAKAKTKKKPSKLPKRKAARPSRPD